MKEENKQTKKVEKKKKSTYKDNKKKNWLPLVHIHILALK